MTRLPEQWRQFTGNAIYDASVAILTGGGFDVMTMERVAETAGTTKGSVYNDYPSKHELACHIFARTIEPFGERHDREEIQP